jgi:hypothetical protein
MANNETYDLLLSMGIDGALAREAAKRYDDRVEAAVEWCFGSGIDVCALFLCWASEGVFRLMV